MILKNYKKMAYRQGNVIMERIRSYFYILNETIINTSALAYSSHSSHVEIPQNGQTDGTYQRFELLFPLLSDF